MKSLARQSARNSMETALWLASHLSCSPGLAGFLQGFLQEFLQGFCGLFSKPTLSQLFPVKKLQNFQNIQKLIKNCCFSVLLEGHRLLPNSFPEQLGKSWERVGKEPKRPQPFARFWAISLIPCKGSCGLSRSVPCRLTLSQFFPGGP